MQESPEIDAQEAVEIDDNQSLVAHQGRKPGLLLSRKGEAVTLKNWAMDLLDEMSGVATSLNKTHGETCYLNAIESQKELVEDPDKTPSAKVLYDIKTRDGSYYQFAKRKSEEHREYFLERKLDNETEKKIEMMAIQSLQEQSKLEAEDTLDFDTFLQKYFNNQL